MKLEGQRLVDVKDKKNIPRKIACNLQELKVDGWTSMKFYHLNRHEYPMYKSLCDYVTGELKKRLTLQKPIKEDETPGSPNLDYDLSPEKNGEELANFESSE